MNKQFFKNAVFLSITEVAIRLKGLVAIPLLTRYFGTFDYGIWSQVSVMVATLFPIMVLGTDSATLRYLPGLQLGMQRCKYSAWCYFLFGMSAIVIMLLLLFGSQVELFFFGSNEKCVFLMPLVAIFLFVTLAGNTFRNWFRIQNDVKRYAFILILQAILELSALIIFLVLRKGVFELVLYTILANSISAVFSLYLIVRNYGWGKPDFSIILILLKFGLPLVPAGYAVWGLNAMDRLFLVHYSTMSKIGIYSLAYNLGYLVIQVLINSIWAMYPNKAAELFNQGKFSELQKLFEQSVVFIVFLILPSIAGICVLGERLLLIIATKEFVSGAPLMAIITAGYLFLMLAEYYNIALNLVFRQYLVTASFIAAALINLVLNMLLIPTYSIMGAALATTLSFSILLLISYSLAKRYAKIETKFRIPLKIFFASLAMGVTLYFLSKLFPYGIVSLLILVTIGASLYMSLIFIFKIIDFNSVSAYLRSYLRAKTIRAVPVVFNED